VQQSINTKIDRDLSVAFVCWQALPAIYPSAGSSVGGLETSAWLLAKSLANLKDYSDQVAFVFRSNRVITDRSLDNVQLVPDYDPREWIRRDVSGAISSLRKKQFTGLSLSLAWQVPYLALTWPWRRRAGTADKPDERLSRLHPDFWIAFGSSLESAAVMTTAAASESVGILMIQSNADLDQRYLTDPDDRNAYGEIGADCVRALRKANLVICQTQLQHELLRSRFEIEGVVLPNAIELEPWIEAGKQAKKSPRPSKTKQVLWIGRYDRFHKRPMLCLEIARECPTIEFKMIINRSDPSVQDEIQRNKPANVSIVAYVPFDQMMQTMSDADIFLSTGDSQFEGFPNVLLQAAATGLAIVSLEDFDGFLLKSKAGTDCCGDIYAAASTIREYATGERVIDSESVRDYLAANHSHTAIARSFRILLESTQRSLKQR
jgi:hypothetical protein